MNLILPSGMSHGGKKRIDRLINEFGYKAIGFQATHMGDVYVAEKREKTQTGMKKEMFCYE